MGSREAERDREWRGGVGYAGNAIGDSQNVRVLADRHSFIVIFASRYQRTICLRCSVRGALERNAKIARIL